MIEVDFANYGVVPHQKFTVEDVHYVVAEIDSSHDKRFKFELFNEKCRVNPSNKNAFALGVRHQFTVLRIRDDNVCVLENSNSINLNDTYALIIRDLIDSDWLKKLIAESLRKYLEGKGRVYLKNSHSIYDFDPDSRLSLYMNLSKLICDNFKIEPVDTFVFPLGCNSIEINLVFIEVLDTFLEMNLIKRKKDIFSKTYFCLR
jgi:hypothetical protein